jgi:hypothetical protein
MDLKLGKLPARHDPRNLKLANYVDRSVVLPTVPKKVGHLDKLKSIQWGMLGNDQLGDCVCAGAGHEHMAWNQLAGRSVGWDTSAAMDMYEKVAGYQPGHPETDQGTDMSAAAKFRRATGILDGSGVNHKIDGYVELEPGNVEQLRIALYLFGAVGVGVEFPSFWMDQFNAGKEWTWRKVGQPNEGHYIPAFASASPRGKITVVSWGREQGMSAKGYEQFNDESFAYFSKEMLVAGRSIDGFGADDLAADLQRITA